MAVVAFPKEIPMTLAPDVRAFLEQPMIEFADVFMNADPTHCGPIEKAQLTSALPARRAMFESAGISGLRLVGGSSETLTDGYVLAHAVWRAEPDNAPELELHSTYILRRTAGGFEVVFYLNHQDLPALLSSLSESDPGRPSVS
jgi:hypothetical protein